MSEGMANRESRRMLIGLIGIVMIVAVLVLFIWGLTRAMRAASPETTAALLTGSLTLIASVATISFMKQLERRQVIQQEHQSQKIPVYEEFMAFLFRLLLSKDKAEDKLSDLEMGAFFVKFTQKLMIWGSDDVVKKFAQWRTHAVATAMNG